MGCKSWIWTHGGGVWLAHSNKTRCWLVAPSDRWESHGAHDSTTGEKVTSWASGVAMEATMLQYDTTITAVKAFKAMRPEWRLELGEVEASATTPPVYCCSAKRSSALRTGLVREQRVTFARLHSDLPAWVTFYDWLLTCSQYKFQYKTRYSDCNASIYFTSSSDSLKDYLLTIKWNTAID